VILDLHWNAPGTNVANQQQPMADLDHSPAFWSSVATTFINFPAIIFDLYNEPDVTSWNCWLNGCPVSNSLGTWSTAGMAQLVAAVRETGATQPIMLGGLNFASDLSQWLAFAPPDPVQPPQLVASVQSYCGSYNDTTVAKCQVALGTNQSSQWPTISAVAKSVPVVTGEFGEYDCATTYVTPYMAFADSIGVSYLGWAWDAYGCTSFPSLVSDYAGTPTNYGVGLKSHLAALKRMHDTHDLNGDGYSDIAWRDSSGNVLFWLMNGAQILSAQYGFVPTTWSIIGQRDFNGDGTSDLLWEDTNGNLAVWLSSVSGESVSFSYAGVGEVTGWLLVGTGDFNGDGFGDILWRDNSGNLALGLGSGGASFSYAGVGNVPSVWTVVGTADFNGDGRTDIAWRDASGNLALWLSAGGNPPSFSDVNIGNVSTNWSLVGTGDFNGDGLSDLAWLDTSGDVAIWLNAGGASPTFSYAGLGTVPTSWSLALTGDFNGDGKSDFLWRDTSGNLAIWFMNGGQISYASLGGMPASWTIQSANAE
jgi:hypothetical protein